MTALVDRLRRRLLHRALMTIARSRFSCGGCRIAVPPGVLNPTAFRASLGFARAAVAAAPAPPADVLELGCGVGLASVLLARAGHRVTATDLDPRAAAAAGRNARGNGVAVRALSCDWDAALAPGERFDLVVVNPPFLAAETPVLRRALYAGPRLEVVAAALAAAARRLRPGGRALVLTSERSGRERVRALVEGAGLEPVGRRDFSSWGERYHLDVLAPARPRLPDPGAP